MPSTQCGFIAVPGGASGSDMLCAYGPTILVNIGFDSAYKVGKPGPLPVAGITGIRALVDSGATESCIDSVLAAQLNLPIIDKRTVGGIGGSQQVNVHLAQVHIPSLSLDRKSTRLNSSQVGDRLPICVLAAQLNLPIIDKRTVGGIGGSQQVNVHLAQVHIPSLS